MAASELPSDLTFGAIAIVAPFLCLGLYLFLRLYGILRPARGIEDLVARTRVVVR